MRASHIKTFPGHGSFISSNLVGETHVPRNAPGTPQANARFRPTGTHARSADEAEESGGACAQGAGSGRSRRAWGRRARRSRVGSGREQRRAESESSVRLRDGAPSSSGEARGLGREQGGGPGENVRSPDKQTYRWPPDGQAAHPGLCRLRGEEPPTPREPTMRSGRPRRHRRNAGADPLGHRSFMESA